ncbi:aminoglycoside phosphotransferase (APT) family kinase protein [Streptomyces sp. SAI-144]|uniref:phosphotransferase family protein n=1 Tax=unclassified Streptomyces TaxID=2593676 RepID=UPI00247652C2|nr:MULTISPECIES: phosphotransferase family protein [unclassified Streptomyces]MDH6436690.1 aminoglycoside phosphotransferase (APT) family kinase protein [Streptomyces sp. SAI-144]MDH6484086.1 aminoglycoside phosphotransferase (APT) family kinase protein [Streptomyces sp. SAI-127]
MTDTLALLNTWPGLADLPGYGPVIELSPLAGGAQNILSLVRRADGTELVLRLPGRHLEDRAADAFRRESGALAALADTDVPHPRQYAFSLDQDSPLGGPFSILEKIDGFTPQGRFPGRYAEDADWRRRAAFALVDGAAKLASVDPYAVGADQLGRPDGWVERQPARYLKMLHGYRHSAAYRETESPHVDAVAEWLTGHTPKQGRTGIVHGDLQFANVMLSHDAPSLAAIVDWEMASLGDPLLDLAWILTAWREEGDPPGAEPYLTPWEGMPSRAELLAYYAESTGRDTSAFRWFEVLACFRLAALLEGSWYAAVEGRRDRATGEAMHSYAEWLWAKARLEMARD